VAEVDVVEAAVDALEVGEARQQLGGLVVRALARGASEAGGAGAHPLDGFRAEARLFDVYARREVFRHGSPSCGSWGRSRAHDDHESEKDHESEMDMGK